MKKKLLLSMLTFFCLVGGSAWAQTSFVQGNLKYTVHGSYVSVRGNFPSTTIGEIVIPSTVTYGNTTYNVTEIEAGAFRDFTGITAMTIPASVTTVRRGFLTGCTGLKKLTVKDSQTPLYFQNNYSVYPNGNDELCVSDLDYYYQGRDITVVSWNCRTVTSAKKIVLGGSMTNIPNHFSDSNTALTEVTIGGNITKIGVEAFDENSSLSQVTITAPVDTMLNSAFYGCEALVNFTIPATVKYIAPGMFRYCTSLEALTIPAGTEHICRGILTGCTSLRTLKVEDSDKPLFFENNYSLYPNGDAELFNAAELESYYQGRNINVVDWNYRTVTSAKKIELGGSMTNIPNHFTDSNTALTEVTIGGNITKIGVEAFDENSSLSQVTITAPIDTMLNSAFYGCEALVNFTIPATVKYIAPGMFRYCTSLEALTIPAGTEHICRGILTGCTSLKTLKVEDSDKPLFFENNYSLYPNGDTELFNSAELESYYQGRNINVVDWNYRTVTSAKKIELSGSMTNVPNYFTQNDTALTTLIIDGNITKIGERAFQNNTALTDVTFVSPVDTILYEGFYGCGALEAIELPQTLKYLGCGMFRYCASLKAITIPASTEHICRGILTSCEGLKTLTIEDSETPLTFENHYSLYPNGTDELCNSELDYFYMGRDVNRTVPNAILVTSPKKIDVAGTVTAIPAYFTKNNGALNEVSVAGNMTKIGVEAFCYCTNLSSVTLDAPIDTIYAEAFYDCEALPAIELPATVKRIEKGTFRYCNALEAFTIPAATEYVGRGIFTSCDALKALTIEDSDTPLFFENNYSLYPNGTDELCNSELDYFYMGRDVDRTVPNAILVSSVKKIDVAGTVTAIPNYFTKSNSALNEVSVAGNMTKIGVEAFCYCTNLSSVTLDAPIDTIYAEAFYDCEALPAIELPATVKRIEKGTFRYCNALEAFTIPAATEYVGRGIFTSCDALKALTIEDSDTPLFFENNYSLYPNGTDVLCDSELDELYLGRNITQVNASRIVTQAKKLTFGQPVTAIGILCNYIANLEKVVTPWQTPIEINDNAFAEVTYSDAILLVPGGKRQAYASAQGWRKFKNIQTWSILVKMTASAHGSIATKYGTASGNTIQFNQPKDEPIVYTLSADNGYKLSALTDNGTAVSPLPQLGVAQSRTISSTEESVTLSATFAPIDYAITYDLKGGTLPSGVTNRTSYNIETATFTLNNPTREHYDFAGWTGTGLNAPTKTVTIAKGSTGDRAYTATWTPATYTVTISGAGVTASNYSPKYGESVVITIADDPDRTLVSLTVNGTDVTAQVVNGKYTITNVSSNIEVVATFRSTKEFITMTSDYATFSCPQDLDFTGSSLRAYIASGFNRATNQVLLTPVKDVPAGTGIFLIGTPGHTYKIPYSETSSIYMNFFQAKLQKGTVNATTGNYSNYVFGEQGGDLGFYPINGSTTLQAQTAYLQLPTSFVAAGVKVSVVFEDDIIDGIDSLEGFEGFDASEGIYDLAGRRLGKTQKGINIVNGKKVLVK